MKPRNVRENRRESGVAMFVAVLLLVLMGWIGLSALNTTTRDQQVAGYQNRSRSAFFAAEAGAAKGRAVLRTVSDRNSTPALPTAFLGDAAMYARWQQQPQYYADPAFPKPIRYVTDIGPAPGANLANPKLFSTLWLINVVGQSYDASGGIGSHRASTVRIEVGELRTLGH